MISPWPAVGRDLDTIFEKEYLFHQSYKNENFMRILVPPQTYKNKNGDPVETRDQFFGVKSLNIFLAQKPYGWTADEFVWDDAGSDYSVMIRGYVDRWLDLQKKVFPFYETWVYIDMYTASKIKEEDPTSDMPDRMGRTSTRFEQFCNDTPGFIFKGVISTQVEASYFTEDIQKFYGSPPYKK